MFFFIHELLTIVHDFTCLAVNYYVSVMGSLIVVRTVLKSVLLEQSQLKFSCLEGETAKMFK